MCIFLCIHILFPFLHFVTSSAFFLRFFISVYFLFPCLLRFSLLYFSDFSFLNNFLYYCISFSLSTILYLFSLCSFFLFSLVFFLKILQTGQQIRNSSSLTESCFLDNQFAANSNFSSTSLWSHRPHSLFSAGLEFIHYRKSNGILSQFAFSIQK